MSSPLSLSITPDTPHVQASSANTATVAAITPPEKPNGAQEATAVFLSARTNNAYVTLDGSAPTAANGIEIVAGAQPVKLPVPPQGLNIRFCSANAAAASVLNALFAS